MFLLVGLGNPGPDHVRQRHNIGFMAVERIAKVHGFGAWRRRFQGEAAEGRLGNNKCLLLKPLTFMNNSGWSVAEAARFFKLEPHDIVVLYDEIDLAPGKVRTKAGGGHAGHNGIRSIHAHFGANYRRVRIGVGHPGQKDKVIGHVLGNFGISDKGWVAELLDAIADAAPMLAEGADNNFQTRVALLTKPLTEKTTKNES
ncbi:MAG: aminoacyl-tRNA hydrolase [Rhodospirillales bacterium]|nr:aminoacyl-tRNA hydrolase [Rhodospirillales bacterium]